MADIIFEEIQGHDDYVGLITLNRPHVLNALNHEMFISLNHQLGEWERNDAIKAVIIRAAEGRAFCAGGDIRHAYNMGKTKEASLSDFFCDEYRLNRRIFHYPKPYIALLDGITMGGGAGISIHGSHRIATENFVFAMPETGIGFFPDVGGSYFLSRLPFKAGFYLGLSGARVSAADCINLGIIDAYVKHDVLPSLISAIVEIRFDQHAKNAISNIISKFSTEPLSSELLTHKNEIEFCFAKKTVEEILYALEKNNSDWCQKIAKIIQAKSPTSLKVTLRELQEGLKLDFDACMQMEYRLATHFLQGRDFYEGVRAAVIDKDQNPRWQPAQLEEVTEQMVSMFFD